MELTDILTLVKAGFTKEEIMQMNSNPAEPVQEQTQEVTIPVPEQEQVQPAEQVQTPVQTQTEPTQPTMADIMQRIAKLTSAVQANAIASSVIPNGAIHQPSAEDMLAEIIRPTYQERSL